VNNNKKVVFGQRLYTRHLILKKLYLGPSQHTLLSTHATNEGIGKAGGVGVGSRIIRVGRRAHDNDFADQSEA
jgi:hypothetical protein